MSADDGSPSPSPPPHRTLTPARITLALLALGLVLVAVAGGAFLALGGLDRLRGTQAIVVPDEYRDVIKAAAKRCPVVPARVLAAQIASESGWDAQAVSSAGAVGIAQFMPEVWAQYGVDGDNDGSIDVTNPVDAIHSAAELNCVNADLVADVPGDKITNILAAYNAGFNMVVKYGGVPPFPETRAYVDKILTRAKTIEL